MYRRRLVDVTRIYGCNTHNSPIHPANKVSSLHWRLQILPVHCLTLQYCYSFFFEFTKVAKELKLMALAEGISIRQYIDSWLMTTNSKQQCQGYTHWGCILSRAWVGSQISKIRFISNSLIEVMVTIRPQGRYSLPNSKEIYCLLGKTVTML